MDAYAAEKSEIGNWEAIGYEAPGVVASTKSSSHTNVINYTSTGTNGSTWTATPVNALNECTTSMNWSLTATATATNVTVADASTGTACKALTPNWSGLLRSSN